MSFVAVVVPILFCLPLNCTSDRSSTNEGKDVVNIALHVQSFYHEGQAGSNFTAPPDVLDAERGKGEGQDEAGRQEELPRVSIDDEGDREDLETCDDASQKDVSIEEWSRQRDIEDSESLSTYRKLETTSPRVISDQFLHWPMFEFWFTATAWQSPREIPDTPKALTLEMAKHMFTPSISLVDLVKTWPSVLYQDYIGHVLWETEKDARQHDLSMDPAEIAITISFMRALYPWDDNLVWNPEALTRDKMKKRFIFLVDGLKMSPSHWMWSLANMNESGAYGNLLIRDLLMPGVHDAGCYKAIRTNMPNIKFQPSLEHWECQWLSTREQLQKGARVFDWRLGLRSTDGNVSVSDEDELWSISHDPGFSSLVGWFRSFYQELKELLEWCNEEDSSGRPLHSGELVIIRLKRNSGNSNKYEEFLQRLLTRDIIGDEGSVVYAAKRLLHVVRGNGDPANSRLISSDWLRVKSTLGDLRLNDLKKTGGCTLALTLYRAKLSAKTAVFVISHGALWRDMHLFGRYSGSKRPAKVIAGQLQNFDEWYQAPTRAKLERPQLKRSSKQLRF